MVPFQAAMLAAVDDFQLMMILTLATPFLSYF